MVLPIGDDNSDRTRFPVVNLVIIALNVFVFVVLQGMGSNHDFTMAWSTVPQEIVSGKDIVTEDRVVQVQSDMGTREVVAPGLRPTPISVYLTLITSMFMHGSIAHLLGNMWFLWVFGDNVEDDMGPLRYTLFYLATGILASLTHVFMNATGDSSLVPCLGASGAISGVMGAYIVLHPKRRVTLLVGRMITYVTGLVAVGIWFAFQVINGLGMLGGAGDGVAYGAHIGGFIAGVALAKPFTWGLPKRDGDPLAHVRNGPDNYPYRFRGR